MSHVHFFKMEEKRLTADRYPLHFEVLGLYPIPVGEMQRWASDSEARLLKSLRFPPKAFVFPAVESVHDHSWLFG
ncbi:hypothetical protein LJR029_004285 [Caballeronia sp. LjRoot29]|uniref:hypothetical protein n=1 Tax=Caballeronia sp. 15715 TaxID=3391030 RepID=UPI0039E4B9CF